MKEKVTKFSRGLFQYEREPLLFSQESIEFGVEASKIYEGSFTITTKNRVPFKGILSKTDHFLKLSETSFSGTEVTVQFQYDATELTAGENHTGSIQVITSLGEYEIPFIAKIEVPYFMTELGKIRDLFQFANLAKHDWSSALKIFKSEQFVKKLLYHDLKTEVLYHSLMKSSSTSHAMEEFLISIHKKVRQNLSVDKSFIQYSSVEESLEDKVVIHKDNWGFTEICVETDADFIEPERSIICSEHFIGNSYELKFLIKKECLKTGENRGFITLRTAYQKFTVEVLVQGQQSQKQNMNALKRQENMIGLTQNYLNFRMNRIAADEYIAQMRILLSETYEYCSREDFYLLKAHIAVSAGEQDEIEESFLYLDEQAKVWNETDSVRYAAYVYLDAMKNRDGDKIKDAGHIIKELYQKEPDNWRIFWFLINVRKSYMEDVRKRFEAIEELLTYGVTSSIIYYEASAIYREHPLFLIQVSEEALPVMNWMVKEDIMTDDVKRFYLQMISKQKRFHPVLFQCLEQLYEKTEDVEVLQAILSMLVRAQKAGSRYFKWFELGVKKQIRILQLYEYYMYSVEENLDMVFPESLVTYFSLNCTLNEKKRAFLYANLIENWEKYGKSALEGYEQAIHEFAKMELEKHVINRYLAILYEELCTSEALDETIKAHLPYVMFQQELRCEKQDITGVCVIHAETDKEVYTSLEDGIAQVSVYTDSAQILLVDRNGNRYATTKEYYLVKYLSLNELANECASYAQENGMLLLYLYEQMETYHNYAQTSMYLRKKLLFLDELGSEFRFKCFARLANQYFDFMQLDVLDAMLKDIQFENFSEVDRVRMMELCMNRKIDNHLEEAFERFGYEKISTKRLLSYCCRKLKEEPEREITPLFVEICFYILKQGKAAKQTIEVLCQYLIGTVSQLISVWKWAKEFSVPCRELEEQIVVQNLFCETDLRDVTQVFFAYNMREDKDKMVVRAYLSYRAYLFLLRDKAIETVFLPVIEEFIASNNCNIINLAYLRMLANQAKLTKEEKEYAEIQVQQFVKQNVILPFFTQFKKDFQLPYEITNKYFVEYHCNANRKVIIHYAINSSHYTEEVLKNHYQGIFVKHFVLFHGDKLSYYITEQGPDYEKRSETITIIYEDDMTGGDSEYSLLNSLLVAKQMQDSTTVLDLMKRYVASKTMVTEQFKMLE